MKIDSGKKIAPSFYISAITHKFAWVCAEAQQGTWKHQFCALLCTCVGNSAEYDRSYYCLLIGCHVQSVEPVVCVCVCAGERVGCRGAAENKGGKDCVRQRRR